MNSLITQLDTRIIVVMGVSGCGKSTIAEYIANQLNTHFKDADELHPPSNIHKMESGVALTDSDRQPWLTDVANYAREQAEHHGMCVIACSALKRNYRHILNSAGNIAYVFLDGSFELIASRMQARTGHFMPETLLQSQFNTLEDPRSEDNVVTINIDNTPAEIASKAVSALHLLGFVEYPKAKGSV